MWSKYTWSKYAWSKYAWSKYAWSKKYKKHKKSNWLLVVYFFKQVVGAYWVFLVIKCVVKICVVKKI